MFSTRGVFATAFDSVLPEWAERVGRRAPYAALALMQDGPSDLKGWPKVNREVVPSGWKSFFMAQVASAALAGLVFIGVSINLTKIMSSPSLPDRALEAIIA